MLLRTSCDFHICTAMLYMCTIY